MRTLSRREATAGAAMLAALLLAWREARSPSPLAPGPGRGTPPLAGDVSPTAGGHAESSALSTSGVSAEDLRDAPAEPAPPTGFVPLLSLPPMTSSLPDAGKAAVATSWKIPAKSAAPSRAVKNGSARGKARAGATPARAAPPMRRADGRAAAAPSASSRPASTASTTADARAVAPAALKPAREAVAARERESRTRTRAPSSRSTGFDLFSPTRAARLRSAQLRARKPPRFRPLRLDRALGPAALRPPPGDVRGPTLAELSPRQPLAKPDGQPARWTETPLPRLEATGPDAVTLDCRKRDGHWHVEDERCVYHAGAGRGLAFEDAWLWLTRLERRWWALPDASHAPWLRHRDRWWVRDEGVWFVLHEGEPWAWRHFSRWEAEGLIHPASGTIIVYSADYARAAVLTPGDGAVLFDAQTGTELARWAEHELPPRWRRPPESLTLPRGI